MQREYALVVHLPFLWFFKRRYAFATQNKTWDEVQKDAVALEIKFGIQVQICAIRENVFYPLHRSI